MGNEADENKPDVSGGMPSGGNATNRAQMYQLIKLSQLGAGIPAEVVDDRIDRIGRGESLLHSGQHVMPLAGKPSGDSSFLVDGTPVRLARERCEEIIVAVSFSAPYRGKEGNTGLEHGRGSTSRRKGRL